MKNPKRIATMKKWNFGKISKLRGRFEILNFLSMFYAFKSQPSAGEHIASVKLQAAWRGFYTRKIINSREPGTQIKLIIPFKCKINFIFSKKYIKDPKRIFKYLSS
jgi:hypothetical protein